MKTVMVTLAIASFALCGVAWGTTVYVDDDFTQDTLPGVPSFDGWTTYSNSGDQTEHGHIGNLYPANGSNIFGWGPPTSPLEGMHSEMGGASVFDVGYGYTGITKSFQDDFMEGETKYFEITTRAIAADYSGNLMVNNMQIWFGLDPTGNTDRDAQTVEWTELSSTISDWNTFIVDRPCEEALETMFIEVRWTFLNGYSVFDVDHVKVWQTPEPASMLLLLAGLPLMRRRHAA